MKDSLPDFNLQSSVPVGTHPGSAYNPDQYLPPLLLNRTLPPWCDKGTFCGSVSDFKSREIDPDRIGSAVQGVTLPVVHCSSSPALARLPGIANRLPYIELQKHLYPKRLPGRASSPAQLQSAIDALLELPIGQKQRALYKPRRHRRNSGSDHVAQAQVLRRHTSEKTLDRLLTSLNLNELNLSAVHVAMGKDGSAQTVTPAKEAYYRKIFEQLDVDNDGKVDVTELKQAYRNMGLWQVPGQAEKFVTASDKNKDGELDVTEFIRYLHEHEMKLKLMFKRIDRDKDGRISAYEMQQALKSVGLSVSNEEVNGILKRMDKDGTSSVDLDEWVEHHLLHPSTDIKDILYYWKHATYMDIGENLLVPDDFTEDEKQSGRWWRLLVSGGTAGAVSRTCTAPFDRLKVLMQVHASKSNELGLRSGFMALFREGGVRGLWRGNGINVIKIAPESALKFFAFERLKHLIGTNNPQDMGMHHRFLAGSLAGAFSQTCIYPMEVIKTRLALRKTGQYNGITDCAYKIYTNEGPRAFFKGYVPNILGILPYAGIDLCIYETLRNYWVKHHSPESDVPSVPLLLACGTISSTCGQLASYPLALIRTKMQAAKASATSTENPTMVSLGRSIYRNEGWTGFYRGIGPNFLKVAPAVGVSYVVYEKMKQELGVS